MEVFTETHLELAMQRAKWLSKASQSCSAVATLIISVVFATMATVPGGLIQEQQDRGLAVYKGKLAFNVFSLIMFLDILTSPYQDSDIVTASGRSQLEHCSSSVDGTVQRHDRTCSSSTRQDRGGEGAAIADKGDEPLDGFRGLPWQPARQQSIPSIVLL
ncbi:hypothetical protein AAC387_Pa07g3142 [Persea americana]